MNLCRMRQKADIVKIHNFLDQGLDSTEIIRQKRGPRRKRGEKGSSNDSDKIIELSGEEEFYIGVVIVSFLLSSMLFHYAM
jgi:hypothetical protein